MDSQENDEITN